MNIPLAVNAVQEFIMPAIDNEKQDTFAVGFFENNKMQFCIPAATEAEALGLAIRFQDLFIKAMMRYEQLGGGNKL